MIFITDELDKFEKNIIELAENVGFKECKTIEAIDLFCGMSEKNDVLKEKDRYYAFIETPQYWSIRADGVNGAIYDNKTKMANIYFKNPIEKRMVSRVEWIDRNNTVYKVDYYNKYGYKYCSENVRGGNVISREFYDRNGDIKVMEQTGSKTYTTLGTRISPKSYRGFADYLEAYLKYNKIYDENIWLTSDEILNKFAWDYGNFKISYLPQNRLNSDLTVITQTNTAFRILCSEEQQVNWYKENSNYKCDRLYSYLENNKSKFGRKEAFIITESDQLEYIEQLINDFPEITFHIAASTIMSDKLTRLDINNNVELYPCITEQKRKELFERCDIYLDINHYRELYNAVNEAMVNNMIILAFDNTAHSKELYPMGNIFESTSQSQSAANVVPTPAPTPAPAVDNAPAPAATITPAATPLAAATPVAPAPAAPAAPAVPNTPIQDAQVPLGVNEEEDNLQNIEDEDTPLAAGGTAKDGIKTWWWWIAAAVAAITGKGVYDNRRRKPAKSDDSEDNSDEK